MLTANYVGNKTMSIIETAPEAPSAEQVQIKVAFTGLCGTDLHVLHGDMDRRVHQPAIIGHEMSGTIAALGSAVQGWDIGDPVTVMPLDWDGTCPACRAGHQHVCQNLNFIGIDSAGSLQQFWNVPASVLVRLPETLRLDHGALVEPVAVAVHDVRRSGLVRGEKVVVIGGGPIGVLIATTAREFGGEVVVVEVDAGRRSAVAGLGFDTIDPRSEDQVEWVNRWTADAGADVVFEVSGSAQAVLHATSLARVRGRLVVVAIHPTPREIDLQRLFWRELTIIGARVYERRDFETAIELLNSSAIPADALITDVVPLTQTAEAFARLESGQAMKILVDCQAGAR